jgi:hypothetical protein
MDMSPAMYLQLVLVDCSIDTYFNDIKIACIPYLVIFSLVY